MSRHTYIFPNYNPITKNMRPLFQHAIIVESLNRNDDCCYEISCSFCSNIDYTVHGMKCEFNSTVAATYSHSLYQYTPSGANDSLLVSFKF